MRTLLTGITGYVGSELIEPLTSAGHELRGVARNPGRADPRVPTVKGDLDTGDGLAEALDGIDLAYYLVHSMEGTADFTGRELRAAQRFARAAAEAGVPRIV
ncbi:MAG: NAD(P)H-binding protein, partial [Solirubrobacteraceae bacterium]|nr:NAD(P)H-binding protein [Solirubrobacteraceae bacterium]